MGGFLGALAALAGPITARVLIALGFSVVTVGGVDIAIGAVKDEILFNLADGPMAALQLAGLSGCWTALGMIFGAMTFAATYWSLTQARKIIGGA
jgi:hypothetical protein